VPVVDQETIARIQSDVDRLRDVTHLDRRRRRR
jgi:hypothetical protein